LSISNERYYPLVIDHIAYCINRNPKKVYTLDNGFNEVLTMSFTDDDRRKLENSVYQHLRRTSHELYYFKEKRECDFLVFENNQNKQIVQVCYQLNDENFDREYQGLLEAMQFFNVNEGLIVTLEQQDEFEQDGMKVKIVRLWDYLME
jgi:predicted AAA+ superfamily ATPase